MMERLKSWARQLKRQLFSLYLAAKRPDVPWYAKAVAIAIAAYAFSPIDLIPDFIPILGYLDDLVLIPLGIALAIRLIPAEILTECRQEADALMAKGSKKPVNWWGGALIIVVWIAFTLFVGWALYHRLAA